MLPGSLSPTLLPSARLSIRQTRDNRSTGCLVPVAASYDDAKDENTSSVGTRMELTRRNESHVMHDARSYGRPA
jgi:hypothetical protein